MCARSSRGKYDSENNEKDIRSCSYSQRKRFNKTALPKRAVSSGNFSLHTSEVDVLGG